MEQSQQLLADQELGNGFTWIESVWLKLIEGCKLVEHCLDFFLDEGDAVLEVPELGWDLSEVSLVFVFVHQKLIVIFYYQVIVVSSGCPHSIVTVRPDFLHGSPRGILKVEMRRYEIVHLLKVRERLGLLLLALVMRAPSLHVALGL